MPPAVDRVPPPWRVAALSGALWLLSLALPVASVMHRWQVGGWRMLTLGWGTNPAITVAWLANPLWLVLTGLVAFGRTPPRWLCGLAAALALVSLVFWDILGPGAWVWLAAFAPWAWRVLPRRRPKPADAGA